MISSVNPQISAPDLTGAFARVAQGIATQQQNQRANQLQPYLIQQSQQDVLKSQLANALAQQTNPISVQQQQQNLLDLTANAAADAGSVQSKIDLAKSIAAHQDLSNKQQDIQNQLAQSNLAYRQVGVGTPGQTDTQKNQAASQLALMRLNKTDPPTAAAMANRVLGGYTTMPDGSPINLDNQTQQLFIKQIYETIPHNVIAQNIALARANQVIPAIDKFSEQASKNYGTHFWGYSPALIKDTIEAKIGSGQSQEDANNNLINYATSKMLDNYKRSLQSAWHGVTPTVAQLDDLKQSSATDLDKNMSFLTGDQKAAALKKYDDIMSKAYTGTQNINVLNYKNPPKFSLDDNNQDQQQASQNAASQQSVTQQSAKNSGSSDMVSVLAPNGKTYSIHKSRLDEALSRGAKVVGG